MATSSIKNEMIANSDELRALLAKAINLPLIRDIEEVIDNAEKIEGTSDDELQVGDVVYVDESGKIHLIPDGEIEHLPYGSKIGFVKEGGEVLLIKTVATSLIQDAELNKF